MGFKRKTLINLKRGIENTIAVLLWIAKHLPPAILVVVVLERVVGKRLANALKITIFATAELALASEPTHCGVPLPLLFTGTGNFLLSLMYSFLAFLCSQYFSSTSSAFTRAIGNESTTESV